MKTRHSFTLAGLLTLGLLSARLDAEATPAPRRQAPNHPDFPRPSAYRVIDRNIATTRSIKVDVAAGRAATIDFSQTDERIQSILLADPSRIVYSTDTALNRGNAKTIFLRTIQPLKFPGATTATVTNLIVKTVDATNHQRLYQFDIQSVRATTTLGVAITNPKPALLAYGRKVSATDIATGLRIALQRGYTQSTDPVVGKVKQLLMLVSASTLDVQTAAQRVQLPLSVVQALAKIAIEERLPTSTI